MVPTCVPQKRLLAHVCHQPKLLCPTRHSIPVRSIFHRLGALTCETEQVKYLLYPLSPCKASPTCHCLHLTLCVTATGPIYHFFSIFLFLLSFACWSWQLSSSPGDMPAAHARHSGQAELARGGASEAVVSSCPSPCSPATGLVLAGKPASYLSLPLHQRAWNLPEDSVCPVALCRHRLTASLHRRCPQAQPAYDEQGNWSAPPSTSC
jgi:hypothetical protein